MRKRSVSGTPAGIDRLLKRNGHEQRTLLAAGMEAVGPALPDEVNAFVEALGGIDGDAVVHDRL